MLNIDSLGAVFNIRIAGFNQNKMEKLESTNKGGNQSQTFKKVIDAEITRMETGQRSGNIHVLTQLK